MKQTSSHKNITKAGGIIPRLAMINDIAGFGRCSTAVSLPVISVMKVQVCPVPTSVLSNHLGFPTCYFQDYTPYMKEYLHAWEQLKLTFDGLYCGFLGSVEQIAIVREFLDSPMMKPRPDSAADSGIKPVPDTQAADGCPVCSPVFLLDPVMGDHGKAYSTITSAHCEQMKELASLADILTPNITEACLLTDTPYREGSWETYELAAICQKLSCEKIVITGLQRQDHFLNFIWENGKASFYETKKAGASRPGTGDLFASILAADALNGVPFARSVQKAADFVALCIRTSEEAGIPVNEGVIFETNLSGLCQ